MHTTKRLFLYEIFESGVFSSKYIVSFRESECLCYPTKSQTYTTAQNTYFLADSQAVVLCNFKVGLLFGTNIAEPLGLC